MSIREQGETVIRISRAQEGSIGFLQEIRERMTSDEQQLLMALGVDLFSPFGALYARIESHRTELVAMFEMLMVSLEAEGNRLLNGGK